MKNTQYEFYVLVDGKKLEEYEHGADTYIEGRKGSEYELYFKNNSYQRVEVVFSVDGLGILDGKTASDKTQGYVVDALKSISVPGWRIDSSKVAKFQFQPHGDKANNTYVEILAEEGFDVDPNNNGVLGCMVFQEKIIYNPPKVTYIHHYYPDLSWPYNNVFQIGDRSSLSGYSQIGVGQGVAYNMMAQSKLSNSTGSVDSTSKHVNNAWVESSVGTGFGDDKKFETLNVKFEREANYHWLSTLQYDTMKGLRKRGIFLVNSPKAKAFPKFKDTGCYVPKNR